MKRCLTAIFATAFVLMGGIAAHAQEVKLPKQLVMASDREGGVAHTMGSGFVSILTKYVGTRATILPVGDPSKWVPMAKDGEVDLGMTGVVNMAWTYWGTGPRKGTSHKDISLLAVGARAQWGFLVPEDSGVKTLADLKKWMPGKKLTHKWVNPAVDNLNIAYLRNLGYSGLEDAGLTAVPVSSYRVFTSLWNEHKVDIAGMPAGIPLVQQMFAARKGRFMPIDTDPEAIKRMQSVEQSYYASKPRPGMLGVETDQPMLTFDYGLSARNTLGNGVVKKILQTLWDHQQELAKIHGALRGWLPANKLWASPNVSFPYHPGAVEFYKEKGVWTPAVEKRQEELLAKSKG